MPIHKPLGSNQPGQRHDLIEVVPRDDRVDVDDKAEAELWLEPA